MRGFVGMINEIAKSPGVDEALRRSEHMLERSQSSAHVGSWEVTLVDHEGGRAGAVQWSDETYRLLGFEPGAVEISDAGFLDYVHPDERQPLCDEWTVHIQRGEPFESDFRIVRPDGTVRLLHTWTDFERDAQGRPTHMVGTCQDVTDRKRAERELLDADRRKDEFLAMLSHELRNPLAPILNAVEILHGAKPDDQELAVQYRAVIARQVRHMKRLLDDLLDVSRVSQGKIQLQKRPIELGTLLLEAVEISRPLITEKRQQLSLALAQDLLPMDADPTRLRAGVREPAQQRRQIHGHGRAHHAGCDGRRRRRHGEGARRRDGHDPGVTGARVRSVRAGDAVAGSRAGWAGNRPHDGAHAGPDAWRFGARVQRRSGPGQRIRGAPAAGDAGPASAREISVG